jgi:4-diphosphocytidyl-2-C-methyl-D-erythritol kinase
VSDAWVRALAPAKVNLTLQVLGRRADGYHEVRSWMLAIDLCDEVRARTTRAGRVQLDVAGPFASADVSADEHNLAHRAADLVLRAARSHGLASGTDGLELRLEKKIPSRSGLGGGSSDAAAAWLAARAALARSGSAELPLRLAPEHLAQLGSDCVFFATALSGLGIASGRGEIVESLASPVPRWWIGLLVPDFGASTAEVYARVLSRAVRRPTLRPDVTEPAALARGSLENELEAAAILAVPALQSWRSLLDAEDCAHWRLSGSGSSWFGIHDEEREARDAVARLERAARDRGLGFRLAQVVRPAGHGACLDREC